MLRNTARIARIGWSPIGMRNSGGMSYQYRPEVGGYHPLLAASPAWDSLGVLVLCLSSTPRGRNGRYISESRWIVPLHVSFCRGSTTDAPRQRLHPPIQERRRPPRSRGRRRWRSPGPKARPV